MALRFSKAFNTTPELWLNMQRDYDLWHAEKKIGLNQLRNIKAIKRREVRTA